MDSQWLMTQFTLNPEKSKADLARAIGLEPSGISKILAGSRQIKAQEYVAMRKFFGLVTDGETAARGGRSFSLTPLQTHDGLAENQEPGPKPDWLATPVKAAEKVKIFQVNENAMAPDFKQGEQVLVDLSDRSPSPPGVFVVSDGFNSMLRHCAFVAKANPPEIKISATIKGFEPQVLKPEDFLIAGRVIAKLRAV